MKPALLLLMMMLAVLFGAPGCAHQPVAPSAPSAPSAPQLLTLEAAALALTRQRLLGGDAAPQAAFDALKRRADVALRAPLRSVTHKTSLPPSGSKNDYMSMGPYWWPDPATASGLPYVQRDGHRNPKWIGNALDSMRLQAMLADTRDLALAYHFTDDIRYARKAAAALRTWFLDPATRMNPSLRFAQGIPGVVDGRGIGIIDTRDLWIVIDAVALLAPSGSGLAVDELQSLRQWFADYAHWMHTSQLGRDAAASENNHGLFYDAQLVAYWWFIGETQKARQLAFDAQTNRVAAQIDAHGRMPLELARTRPFHYQTFALEAATRLARYGHVLSVPIDDKSLRAALNFVAAVVQDPASWRHATALEPTPPLASALPVLLFAQRACLPGSYSSTLAALQPTSREHVAWLLWPLP
jgi:hypothetical protein